MEVEIARMGLALLPQVLGNRLGYAHAFAQGMGVGEAAPLSVAAREFAALAEAIEEIAG
jgi:chromosome partitioning protein